MRPDVVYVAITFADASVGIMQFVTCEYHPDGTPRWRREASKTTIDHEIARSAFDQPVTSWRPLDPTEIPADRTYRNALRDRGVLVHDLPAAREIHRELLRRARGLQFAALDVAYQRADETEDTEEKKRIVAEKHVLRDLPADPVIEAAQTIDALTACWPKILS